ncbi:MAG: DUF1405 domain-containing protein [Thermoflexales bacterium]|nr:DUF1405 domain-containing protein [Thermoflexales bacterium]
MVNVRLWSDWVIASRALVWLIFAACLFAFVFGTLGWYGEFLATIRAPVWSLPFIPDCPLAAGLFGLAVVLLHYRRSSNLLNQLTAVACIKYGTWTMAFWALYWMRTGNVELSSLFSGPVMFITHLGLTVMGALLLLYVRPNLRDSLLTAAWFVASDLVDYAPVAPNRVGGYGYYPPLPSVNGDPTALVMPMLIQAVLMTLLLCGGLLVRAAADQRTRLVAAQRAAQT